MTGIVDWAASRARMVMAFILLSLVVGGFAYVSLPKEGEPDIDIPAVVVSMPFQGISAEDSEKLLVKPMEAELASLDGLESMSSTAVDGYANIVLEFEFGWDKSQTLADVRDAMQKAEANFPSGGDAYTIEEINFSEFPILIVSLSGAVPERTLLRVAKDLQDRIESMDAVLEASLAGHRDEMLEVIIDPLKLEAYNVTAGELINVVVNNNQLIPAGAVDTDTSSFAVKIPSSFDEPTDVFDLPVKTNGDRVVTLGDIADIRLTFQDREGTARFDTVNTVALQVVKRKGFNLIDTSAEVRTLVESVQETWPQELRDSVDVTISNDQSRVVASMVSQLEGSVLTAIALVMIVVLAALGTRPALLVGFAIPTSFLLCFAFLAVMGITISNIVMFGLILAVGMLVDGAIVVVEYADKRIREGAGPMEAYTDAAKRMFWPIVSSTATTLCAFLPMLFWPGVPGEFMGMLPVTLIFVLSASLVVALVYLPVLGGVTGRVSRTIVNISEALRRALPWVIRVLLVPPAIMVMFIGAMQTINPSYLMGPDAGATGYLAGAVLFVLGCILTSIVMGAAEIRRRERRVYSGHRRTGFGMFIKFIAGNPIMPIVVLVGVVMIVINVFSYFGENNNGVEFFVATEPEQAIVYVRARGNLSLEEKDRLLRQAEEVIVAHPAVDSTFSFAGAGGLNSNTGGASGPLDTIGQAQIELIPWENRPVDTEITRLLGVVPFETAQVDPRFDGDRVLNELETELRMIPGIQVEILNLAMGPASGKPVHLRMKGDSLSVIEEAVSVARTKFESTAGLIDIEDNLPLPGIDWQIDVDVEQAGRYGADVATVGGMVQLVTRGILLDTMRVDSSDEEIEIRVRFPEDARVLSTLDTLKVRTPQGLVPLSNFISREPVPRLGQINRVDQKRYYDLKADVAPNLVKFTALDGVVLGYGTPDPAGEFTLRGETYRLISEGTSSQPADLNRVYDTLIADVEETLPSALNDMPSREQFTRDFAEGLSNLPDDFGVGAIPVTANERIETLNEWLATNPLPVGIEFEWTGDQEDQEESGAFLQNAFAGALGLMFIILLAQFNSFYNATLVLLAVVLSTTGVLIGMLVMNQPFSIIMTGTGIVALAGIVVNNNIVLIDTFQEYSRYMPRIEAIVRTAEARIRPVLLTTITTMAGLAPMMFGLSLDFIGGGYTIESPTSLWWIQLATAVVWGLGVATMLTLVFTPSMLALRVWATTYVIWFANFLGRMGSRRTSRIARDFALKREARRVKNPEIIWEDTPPPAATPAE
ncbi:efflux RND transporter permease subunit [Shimia ponticola]|uniref:efflux RND transporter permease subunit n=1 Tax=Shimia ponticola TaxID=2582893 RepID=UPI0011BF5E14|nr:efflux RND transporter permease subunit [Shimia ponticola]